MAGSRSLPLFVLILGIMMGALHGTEFIREMDSALVVSLFILAIARGLSHMRSPQRQEAVEAATIEKAEVKAAETQPPSLASP